MGIFSGKEFVMERQPGQARRPGIDPEWVNPTADRTSAWKDNADRFKTFNQQTGQEEEHWEIPSAASHLQALRDPNSGASSAFQFGGKLGAAKDAMNRLAGAEEAARARAAPTIDRAGELAARGQLMSALGGLRGQLAGTGPSMAPIERQQGLDAAARAMMAGGSPLAGAGAAQSAVEKASQTRFGELAQAQQGIGALGTALMRGDQEGTLRDARIGLQARAQNDALAGALAGNRIRVGEMQMQGAKAQQLARQGLQDLADTRSQGIYAAEKAERDKLINQAIAAGEIGVGTIGTILTGGAAAPAGAALYADAARRVT